MSDTQWKHHPGNPANQKFNISGSKNRTKRVAWWQLGTNNNRKTGGRASTSE